MAFRFFSKMHGLGNDFMVINAIEEPFNMSPTLIKAYANRHTGIGFDQLLVVERPSSIEHDFKYRIFNADGQEVAQCGNGARCFAYFIHIKGLSAKRTLLVETQKGVITLNLNDDGMVMVDMGPAIFEPAALPLMMPMEAMYRIQLGHTHYDFRALSMGNPHAVITVEDIFSLQSMSIDDKALDLQNSDFFPESVNVGFMAVQDRHCIQLRVFERGVGETQACGTGACAAAVAAIEAGYVESPVTVVMQGGSLTIDWRGREDTVRMTGPAVWVFDGTMPDA
jgi:diaminopimelate epimerase